jgi:hypothetical protein
MPEWIVQPREENQVLPPGDYPAVVVKANVGLVQSGKYTGSEKMELSLRVNNQNTVRDNLIWAQGMHWKLTKFVEATRFAKAGERANLTAENVISLSCIVTLTQQEVDGKNGKMTVNRISDYKLGPMDDFLAEDEP